MIVLIYLRKSRSDNQGESIEETLRKHEITLRKYAEEHQLIIAKVYPEVVSGDSLYCRPEMLKLLEAVETGEYDAVLCMDIDRLGRGGMKDQGIILEAFKNSETKIITPEKVYDLSDEMDEELTEFKTFMSRREYKMITKRLRRGIRQTVNNGGFLTTAPYGYSKGTINKIPSLIINEDEAQYVRTAFKMYADGNSTSTIAEYLTNIGGKTRKGLNFSRSTIRYIISNPVYTGKVVWYREKHIPRGKMGNDTRWTIPNPEENWTVVDGVHEPLIDEETFKTVQRIRTSKSIPSCKKSKHGVVANPFAGILFCGNCSGKMQRQGPVKGVPYMLCPKAGCIAGAKQEFVEEAVLNLLKKSLERLELGLNDIDEKRLPELEKTLTKIKRELDLLNSQQERLYDLLEQGVYDINVFQQRKLTLQEKITKVQKQQEEIEAQLYRTQKQNDAALIEKIKHILAIYSESDAKQKNRLLKSAVEKIYYYKDKKTDPKDFRVDIVLRQL